MVDKIANPAAINAYANTAKLGDVTEGETAGKATFLDMMKNAVVDSISTMKQGEVMSAKAVTGEASLPDVVSAVNAAELTLNTVVAVRDRLVNAYQELMRMPI